MPIKIDINPERVEARISQVWEQKVLHDLSMEILADCNEYCKEDHSNLISSSYIHSEPEIGKLIWQTPYAKRQYWEIKTSLTPGRTWKWCEAAKRKWKERWQRLAEKGLRDNL